MPLIDSLVLKKSLVGLEITNKCTSMDYSVSKISGLAHAYDKKLESYKRNLYIPGSLKNEVIEKTQKDSNIGSLKDLPTHRILYLLLLSTYKKNDILSIECLLSGNVNGNGCNKDYGLNPASVEGKTKSLQESTSKVYEESNKYELEQSSELLVTAQNLVAKGAFNENYAMSLKAVSQNQKVLDVCMKLVAEILSGYVLVKRIIEMTGIDIQSRKLDEYHRIEVISFVPPISKLYTELSGSDLKSQMPALSDVENSNSSMNESTISRTVVCEFAKDDICTTYFGVEDLLCQDKNDTKTDFNDFFPKNYLGYSSDESDSVSFDSISTDESDSGCDESEIDSDQNEEIRINSSGSSAYNTPFQNKSSKALERKRMDSGVDLSYDNSQENAEILPTCNCEKSRDICNCFLNEFEIGLASVNPNLVRKHQRNFEIEKYQQGFADGIIESVATSIVCSLCHRVSERFGLLLNCEHHFCFECVPHPLGDSGLSMDIMACPSCGIYSPGVLPSECLRTVKEKEMDFYKHGVECIKAKVLSDQWCRKVWAPTENQTKSDLLGQRADFQDYKKANFAYNQRCGKVWASTEHQMKSDSLGNNFLESMRLSAW